MHRYKININIMCNKTQHEKQMFVVDLWWPRYSGTDIFACIFIIE